MYSNTSSNAPSKSKLATDWLSDPRTVRGQAVVDDLAVPAQGLTSKRVLDICVATLGLIISAPLLLIIAVAIRLDSSGSPLFVQQRVGAKRLKTPHGVRWQLRLFRIYKFRTMTQNADGGLHARFVQAFVSGDLASKADSVASAKLTHDPRITRLGAFLRRTSLDELPQLFNVLKGDMSLVGPRPVPVYEVDAYEPRQYARLAALPGITCIWQIEGRGRVGFEEMVNMDVNYIKNRSLLLDLKLLLRTVPAVLRRRGAK